MMNLLLVHMLSLFGDYVHDYATQNINTTKSYSPFGVYLCILVLSMEQDCSFGKEC